ncbi:MULTISPECIES: acyl-CoA thioesterase [Natrinema]|uniref:Thioesterase superfamily protein n=1 Tax=Natrinema gari JCM 14663 TaxID=1230459 RepID=L9Z112_9EURY|nr:MULTISPECIES: acyl-CoA thioesterase [Natrinema]AFO55835.1 thioesterase superfamily protein [Natrinema sp. J7-2]ELY79581.1 thioesterase superfamily protein [Natrinema gari JCM 14663]
MPTLLETRIENRFRVQPNHANNNDTLHGGNLMKWLDEVGAMSAMRFAGETCVTARVNELDFERPIRIGDTALVEAYVYDSGRTSVHVALRAWREEPRSGETEKTTESTFTFVAIDENGETVPVPDLSVETEKGERLRDRVHEIEA